MKKYFTISNIIFYFVKTIKLFMEKKDIRDEILDHLESIERPLAWLSNKTEIPYATLYSVFKQKNFALSDSNLAKINRVLDTDFINY